MIRTFIPIAGNQLAALLLGILGLRLVSQFVPAEVNGLYGLFLSLTQVGMLLTHSGLINHATRYWQREQPRRDRYARFVWATAWMQLRSLLPLLLLIAIGWAYVGGQWSWLWAFPFLVVGNLALALNAIATGALNAEHLTWRVFMLTAIGTAARILLPVGFALATTMTYLNLSAGFALHGLLIMGCIVLLFRRSVGAPAPAEDDRNRWRLELRHYGRPFLWLGLGSWLLQFADRWVVAHFFGERTVGLFTYASQIGSIIPGMAAGGLMQWAFPRIFRRADGARSRAEWLALARTCDRVTVAFLALTILGVGLLVAVAPLLVGPLIRPQYRDALAMLVPAAAAMVTVQVNQFHFLLLQGQHNSAGMVRIMLVVAGLKTLGCIAAAAISWQAFAWWLVLSLVLSAVLGRVLIRRMALREAAISDTA